jgi:hypothetical protein
MSRKKTVIFDLEVRGSGLFAHIAIVQAIAVDST